VIALGIRLLFAWDYASHRPRQALSVIPFLFESGNIAHSVATGKGFASPFRIDTGPTAWTTPLYPLLLGGLMRLFGPYTYASYAAAVAVNILFSSLVCVPLYFAGKRIGGAGLGALAAWLWAIFPNAILLTYESLWETCVSAWLGAALLWATLRVSESARARAWCAYGLLFGLTLMTNAALLSLLPLLAGWALYRSSRRGQRWLRNAALTAGLAAAGCLPWTIRNYTVFHTLIPLRSILGLQLWVGNNPEAKVIWLGEQHPIHDQIERQKYIDMGEVAYMRQKEADAVAYMASHPGREMALVAGRFVSLWSGGTPTPLHDFLTNSSFWFRYVLLFNVAAGLGALAGIFFLIRERSPYAFPSAVYPLVYPWAYYLTLALPRYRHPIDPIVLLLTAVSVLHAASRGKPPAKRTPVPAVHGIDPPIIRTYNG
jgi:Dolichyl-phosphate-mannose-protein mannosyltransferase